VFDNPKPLENRSIPVTFLFDRVSGTGTVATFNPSLFVWPGTAGDFSSLRLGLQFDDTVQ